MLKYSVAKVRCVENNSIIMKSAIESHIIALIPRKGLHMFARLPEQCPSLGEIMKGHEQASYIFT